MLADTNHLTVIQHNDLVCVHNGAYALSNDNSCGIGKLFRNAAPDRFVGLIVERREGVIENQYLGLSGNRSCDTESLLLTAGEVRAALSNGTLPPI